MKTERKTPGHLIYKTSREHAIANGAPTSIPEWENISEIYQAGYELAATAVLADQWRPVSEPPKMDHHVIVVSDDHTDCQAVKFSLHGRTRRFWMHVPPLPLPPVDPYADLKAAHAAGKVIQHYEPWGDAWVDFDKEPDWGIWPLDRLRIKPWALSRHLPGFRPLEDGEEWHRQDFTEDMLPEGWRPCLLGETGESQRLDAASGWSKAWYPTLPVNRDGFYRTTHPLPPVAEPTQPDELTALRAKYDADVKMLNDRLIERREAYEAYISKLKRQESPLDSLIESVKQWGVSKGITGPDGKATLETQAKKMIEEAHETRDAVEAWEDSKTAEDASDARGEIIDGIGDTTVTLILLSELLGVPFDKCLQTAYAVISKRKGAMVNGTFVKEVES